MVDVLAQETHIEHMNDENMDVQEPHEGDEKPKEEPETPMEEGELPEEGEITDEDETPAPTAARPQAPSTRGPRPPKPRGKASSSHPPARHPKPPPKYKEQDPKTASAVPRNSMMESWINGVQKKNKHSPTGPDFNEEYYRVGDAHEQPPTGDPFQPVDEFGDVDYRTTIAEAAAPRVRRRSGSPPVDDFGTVPKRSRLAPAYEEPVGGRRGPAIAPTRWTQATICKFFREGYCRDGDACVFSHNASDSKRRPELCRFYERGYCKRGLSCPNLHGEFPCKAFHKGDCPNEPCRFSHNPLDEFTRPLFEQVLRDEEMAKRVASMAGTRPKRRVLIPNGPAPCDNYALEKRSYADHSRPPRQLTLYPPTGPSRPAGGAPTSFGGFFNAHPAHPMGRPGVSHYSGPPPVHQHPYSPPHQQPHIPARRPSPPQQAEETFNINDALGKFTQPTPAVDSQLSSAPAGSVSPSLISDSLQSLQNMFDSGAPQAIVEESPASPPAGGVVASDSAPLIPISRSFVAYPLDIPPSTSLDLNLIQQITSGRYKNDPRLKRIAEKQFDLVSQTLNAESGLVIGGQSAPAAQSAPPRQDPRVAAAPSIAPMAAPAVPKPADPRDPRVRDPRAAASSSAALPPTHLPNTTMFSGPPTTSAQPLPGHARSEMDFQSMVEQQIAMANAMAEQQAAAAMHRPDDYELRGPPVHDPRLHARPPPDPYSRRMEPASPPYTRGGRGGGRRGRGGGRGGPNANYAPLGRGGGGRFGGGDDGPPHGRRGRPDDHWAFEADGRPRSSSTSPRDHPADHAPAEQAHAPLTLREKRKDNEYESPLTRNRTNRF